MYKFSKVTHISTNMNELEEIIKDELGLDYEICPYEEFGPGVLDKSVTKPDSTDKRHVREMIRTKKCKSFRLQSILNVLCGMKRIPEGEYLIDCNW